MQTWGAQQYKYGDITIVENLENQLLFFKICHILSISMPKLAIDLEK